MEWFSRLSFRAKLEAFVVLLSLGMIGAAIVAVERAAQTAAREKIESDFRETLSGIEQMIRIRLEGIQGEIGSSLSDALFAEEALSSANEHERLAAAELPIFIGHPVVAVVDANGRLLYSKAKPDAVGTDLSSIAAIPLLLKNSRVVDLWHGGDEMLQAAGLVPRVERAEHYLIAGRAIESGGRAVGAVIAGEAVTETLLPVLEESFKSTVALVTLGGKAIVGARLKPREGELQSQLDAGQLPRGSFASEVGLAGEPYLVLGSLLRGHDEKGVIGSAYVMRSLEEEMGPFRRRVRTALAIVLVVAAAVSMLGASELSRRMTEPLKALERGVRRIQKGDLDASVDVTSRDEMGRLARAFNDMSRGLREKHALEKVNAELKALDESKTRFFSNVSHELRTPLTLILGPLESMISGNEKPDRPALEAMASNARRLLRQVNMLLDFAKLDAGRMRLNLEEGGIGRLLSELVAAARPQAERRRQKLTIEGLDGLASSRFDPDKVEVIAANLLSNALKFTPAGGAIGLRAWSSREDVRFEVRDTGPGIPAGELPRLFERFHQVDDAATRKHEGTGLGLAMVRDLARLHGGDVMVESELGKGTAFTVTLPLSPDGDVKSASDGLVEARGERRKTLLADVIIDASEDAMDGSVAEGAVEMVISDPDKPSILYADDNSELRAHVSKILSPAYNVLLAPDGVAALEVARAEKPELILSDLMMPRMTGIEFCASIREDPELRHIPFVLLTAKAGIDTKIEGLEEGADDYLSKPFSQAELLARIKNLITMRKHEAELKRQLQAAREIQRSLLPEMPQELGEATIDALYHPSEELSGDFYDAVIRGDWLYFYLADVTSHGTAAAQVTYLLKEIFHHALAKDATPPIDELMAEIQAKYSAYQLPYDIAIQAGRYQVSERVFEYFRGNAPAAMRVQGDGTTSIVEVEPGDPLVARSPFDDAPLVFPTARVTLGRGEKLYLYTDGTYEFRAGAAEFGRKRLRSVLKQAPGSHEWKGNVFNALIAANQSPFFPDDLTILRLSVTAESAPPA